MTAISHAVTRRVAIEQAIARGETVIETCRRLRVSEDDVCDVWLRMERINELGDTDNPARRGRRPRRTKGRPLAPCGTRSAFDRHKRRGEPIDAECADAERAYQAERWQRRAATQRTGVA